MSRRTLLSPEQRTRLFGIPTDPAKMATHYVLSSADLERVQEVARVELYARDGLAGEPA